MRRTVFLIGLLLEFVLLFGLFVPYVMRVQGGTTIQLKTIPVDPRSIFRGDYVTLSYEVGTLTPTEQSAMNSAITPMGKTVYLILAPKGDVYERVGSSVDVPVLKEGEVCLKGMYSWNRIDFPDIAQYFVSEGAGMEIEQARNTHRLIIEASVSKNCRAVITGLQIGEEAPLLDQDMIPDPFAPIQVKPVPAPTETR